MNLSRILLGLVLIVGAGGALASGTAAFFSDTEISDGNTFTAGSVDLKIDHALQTYNDQVVGGSLAIVSDSETQVDGHDAVPVTFVHAGWTADIPGATWIWGTDGPTDPTTEETFTFTRTFDWSGTADSAQLEIAADNYYEVFLNGDPVGSELSDENNFQAGTQDSYDVSAFLQSGANTLTIIGTNKGVAGSDGASNPAGILFRLAIDGGETTWTEKDLEDGDVFWDFDDVKPGDRGTNVISLHSTGDAFACMMTENVEDDENQEIDPETVAGDDGQEGIPNGELSQFLQLFIWSDDGDGAYEPGSGEEELYQGGFTDVAMDRLALQATTTAYLGSAWCFGAQSVDGGTGEITCDGSSDAYNIAQTDILTSDLLFTAVQQSGNEDFQCGVPEEPEPEPEPEFGQCEAGQEFADAQLGAFDQGTQKGGASVLGDRSVVSAAFGAPQTSGLPSDAGFPAGSFLSLGFKGAGPEHGSVVLDFSDNVVVAGSGADLAIYEVTGGMYPDEKVKVEISQNGSDWFIVSTGATRDSELNIEPTGLAWARYVRLTDVSDVTLFADDADGYDVDAIEALNCGVPEQSEVPSVN